MTIPPKTNALNANRSLNESSNKMKFPTSSFSPSPPSSSYLNLPLDPKSWNSAHVATYLTYSLQLYPPETVFDLSYYVQNDLKLTGRRFLRLEEENLKQVGFNESWIKLILLSVKALRREQSKVRREQLKEKISLKGCGIVRESDELECKEFNTIEAYEDCSPKMSPTLNSSSNVMSNDISKKLQNAAFSDLVAYDKELIRHELFQRNNIKMEPDKEMDISVSFSRVLSNASEWAKNEIFGRTTYMSGFTQGVMLGGFIVWTCMRAIR
ncbi:4939_t:CDS:2 [Scutellospora calospora]|uniref:4939_t:CDS:1 n=1 Tax=Scutellospora calospora TaxID=85575 RepID=A0ACA9MCK6_9GLOM|nr:4939_t:CDS:2 [Scutellospora calospora]